MKFQKVSIIVLMCFSLLGFLVTNIIIHENIHRFDAREVEKRDEHICYLSFNEESGFYAYEYDGNDFANSQKADKAEKYTEYRAYTSSIILIFIYIFCFLSASEFIRKRGNNDRSI